MNTWQIIEQPRPSTCSIVPHDVLFNEAPIDTGLTYDDARRLVAGDAADDDRVIERYTSTGRSVTFDGKALRQQIADTAAWDAQCRAGGNTENTP